MNSRVDRGKLIVVMQVRMGRGGGRGRSWSGGWPIPS